ncbi:hypothetical protein HF086_016817 [Spodoptera exigua]|uniref:Ubiquitin-like domain-containing protein n=1 Tax=Spodoptera exigua TaxID=7107 RepID=A0A922SHF6_SPOEX|nr:hypothetical protein HF086_016817 [Spodoptera exigua]
MSIGGNCQKQNNFLENCIVYCLLFCDSSSYSSCGFFVFLLKMDNNLQHEDLLIKLRGKLNQEKVKLWEAPFITQDNEITQNFKDIVTKYAKELSLETDVVQQALRELQLHSLERSKDNEEFKETGLASFRIKATIPGEKPKMMKFQKKLECLGSELIAAIAAEIGVTENRVKLIFNGKVIKPTPSLEQQGLKNGATMMALVMAGLYF